MQHLSAKRHRSVIWWEDVSWKTFWATISRQCVFPFRETSSYFCWLTWGLDGFVLSSSQNFLSHHSVRLAVTMLWGWAAAQIVYLFSVGLVKSSLTHLHASSLSQQFSVSKLIVSNVIFISGEKKTSFVQTSCQRRQCTQTCRLLSDTGDTDSDRGIQGKLEQTFTRETHCSFVERPQFPDLCKVKFLHRVIRWVVPPFGKAPERIDIEADPRHAELFIRNSGLQTNSKGVDTPKLSQQNSTFYCSNVMWLAYLTTDRLTCQQRISEIDGGTDDGRCGSTEEMHSFLVEVNTIHPELRKTGNCAQADDVLKRFKLCRMSAKQEEHEFVQDIPRETSLEIYFNNTCDCQRLECWSCFLRGSQAAAGIGCASMMRDLGEMLQQQGVDRIQGPMVRWWGRHQ